MSGRSLARTVVATVIVCGVALASGAALAASIPLSTRQIALDPADHARHRVGDLQFLGGLDLRSDEPAFGGLSGLSVTADGQLAAVTDRGHWFTARIVRDAAGRLVGLADGALGPLRDPDGGRWRGSGATPRRWSAWPAATGW